jgi:hypothetical protein
VTTSVNWSNPYADRRGRWLRGNLHTHSSPASGCARVPLERTLELYSKAGYDFLSLSDHMTLTRTPSDCSGLVFIPGMEWNAPDGSGHTGIHSCDPGVIAPHAETISQQELLDVLSNQAALCILNHPDWLLRPHYRREELEALSGYDGIEILNGSIKWDPGREISTDKWDYLLSKGKRVLGFASDDFHSEHHLAQGWIVARAESATPEAIFAALKSGNFYASSGVELVDVWRDGDVIGAESVDGQEIRVVGNGGGVLHIVEDRAVTVNVKEFKTDYLWFEIYGRGSQMAWTQPFFIDEM